MSDDDLRIHVITYERVWIESGLLLTSRERQEMKASARIVEAEWTRRGLTPDIEVLAARIRSDSMVIIERYAVGTYNEREAFDAIHRHVQSYERDLRGLITPRD